MNATLSIGQLSQETGVSRDTLRYYERIGLLIPEERTSAGYRQYGRLACDRLRFIKRAQAFGFSLEEISVLTRLRAGSPRSCARVLAILDRKLEELARHLAELNRFHRDLSEYRERCRDAVADADPCPVILEVSRSGERNP